MSTKPSEKISIEELERQFDNDVERFSNEQTGQTTTVDAALVLSMVEQSILKHCPDARKMCDIGCGAGNFSLRIARKLPRMQLTLLDLSSAMLERAKARLSAENFAVEKTIKSDIAQAELPKNEFDLVVAAASLHHLRTRDDWQRVFERIYQSLVPGGSFWMWDLVRHENEFVEKVQKERYAEYLTQLRDQEYQRHVFDYIERSDSPETLSFIMETLHSIGFRQLDVIHKNVVFAALVAVK